MGLDPVRVTRYVWTEDEQPLATEYDHVIVAGYRHANTALRDELSACAPELEIRDIGDASAPRLLRNAISEGARIGAAI